MNLKNLAFYIMPLFYMFAGVMHFLRPKAYLSIMPSYLSYPLQLVYFSGICEFLFGLLICFPPTRPIAAWLLILLLIAIFPANIQMAINFYQKQNSYLWLAILRLPLQFVLIWWAWLYTKD